MPFRYLNLIKKELQCLTTRLALGSGCNETGSEECTPLGAKSEASHRRCGRRELQAMGCPVTVGFAGCWAACAFFLAGQQNPVQGKLSALYLKYSAEGCFGVWILNLAKCGWIFGPNLVRSIHEGCAAGQDLNDNIAQSWQLSDCFIYLFSRNWFVSIPVIIQIWNMVGNVGGGDANMA